jgi:glycosyltransferase involved in cell wall biosynthesis
MPHYNHGHVLKRAVDAFLAQTVPVEIIIVDDASSDDSARLIAEIARSSPRVRVVLRQENSGPSAAIRDGLAIARGPYVSFSSADDVVEPRFAELSAALLDAHPGAALSFADPSSMAPDGTTTSVSLALADGPVCFAPERLADLFRRNSFTISSNTVVYRREMVQAIGGFRPDLKWQADWMTNLVLGLRHGACYRPTALAHFSEDDESYGSRGVRSAAGQREMLFACLRAFIEDYPDVVPLVRHAAMLPEMRLRVLAWLMSDSLGRRFITPHLVRRLISREAWTLLRPLAPLGLRRWMRRQAGRASRPSAGDPTP